MVGHLTIQYSLGMDCSEIAPRGHLKNSDCWLDNMRKYSRMANGGDNKDHKLWVAILV